MVALRRLLPGAGRKRKPRPDPPKTIVPPRAALPGQRFDAARERLKQQIPPRGDDAA